VGHCGGGLTYLGPIRSIGDQIVTLFICNVHLQLVCNWSGRDDDMNKEPEYADDGL
jgi:hypothetical protein